MEPLERTTFRDLVPDPNSTAMKQARCVSAVQSGLNLRAELSLRSMHHASMQGYLHDRTGGLIPSILFGVDQQGRHGNFHSASYECIQANANWSKRLQKAHTAYRRVRACANWVWKELDCSNSSDALLMNIFCYPGLLASSKVSGVLGIRGSECSIFGFKPRTPLSSGRYDNTEIDLCLGDLLIEAKLTESNFQFGKPDLVRRYRDFEAAFNDAQLPLRNGNYVGYQLIRGVLAAYAREWSFCVMCDARRPDLIDIWFSVMRAVQPADLRCRLKLLTWQELAVSLPAELQAFIATKYGIFV